MYSPIATRVVARGANVTTHDLREYPADHQYRSKFTRPDGASDDRDLDEIFSIIEIYLNVLPREIGKYIYFNLSVGNLFKMKDDSGISHK